MAVILPYQPTGALRLRPEFQTKVQFEERGSEHRTPFADQIRYRIGYRVRPEDQDLQAFRKSLEDLRTQRVKVPDWVSGTKLTALAAIGATTLSVDSLPRDWNVNEVIISLDDQNYEVATLSALPSGTTINLSSGLAANWPGGTAVYPLRSGVLENLPELQGISSSMSDAEISFVEDYGNQFTKGVFKVASQFRGRPILDLNPDFKSPIESFEDRVNPVALGFGNSSLISESDITIRRHNLQYLMEETEAEQLIGVFAQSLGRARSFWLPSSRSNWRLGEDVAIYGSTLKLEQDGFRERWENRDSDKFLAVVTDGVVTPVEVYNVESSGGFDVVHLKDQLKVAADKETTMVCELSLVRFSSDALEINYQAITSSTATISMVEVPFEYEGKGEISSRFESVSATGTFQSLPEALSREITVVNSGTNGLDIRRVGSTEILKLPGNHAITLSCSSPSEYELRRTDLIATGISIGLIVEALNEEHPAWLYEFTAVVSPSNFATKRLTSYHRELVAGGETFAAGNLTHSRIQRTSRLEGSSLTIDAIIQNSSDPLWSMVEETNPEHVKVTVYETKAYAPATSQVLYEGVISKVANPEKDRLTLSLKDQDEFGEFQMGRNKLCQRCVVSLFSQACGLQEADLQETGSIVAISSSSDRWPIIDCSLSGSRTAQFFRGGKVTVGNEVRSVSFVEKIGSNFRLYLTFPFKAAAVSGVITVTAGCDKAFPTCQGFGNTENFRAAPYLPPENPTLKALEIPQQNVGGKK